MKRISTALLFVVALLFLASASVWAQTYLSQDFEAAWTGTPAAPPGWTQSRVVLLGDGIPEPNAVNGEKDWEQNTNTGPGTWAKNPSATSPVKPNAAVSGTGALYMQDYNFGSTSSGGFGSRRLESPSINLSTSTSPYVRFWLFYAATTGANNLRVMASSNGGTTWNSIMVLTSNAGIVGTMTSATPWQRVNVLIPVAYRTASAKIAIEYTNIWGFHDIFIDDLSVEEFTPATITSAGTGNWSAGATWTGGVVPTADHHISVAAGHVVTIDVNTARCQNVTLDGTLNFSTAASSLQAFGDLAINATGIYNAFQATTGKITFLGGNLNNAGTIDFSVGTPTTWFTGGSGTSFTNTGTIVNARLGGTVLFANPAGLVINSAVTMTGGINLVMGSVNPNGLLTLGNPTVATTQTISVGRGDFSAAPTFAAGMTSRSVTYTQFFAQPATPTVITPGEEIEQINGLRTVTGTLTITTYNNVSLGYPLWVGNVGGTTGALTLTRGILITTPTNLLTLNPFVSGSTGTLPSILTPPTTHGSYVVGPIRINFPATGTTSRNFPLGLGTNFNGPTPSSNVRKTATLANTAAWASQTITASLGAPATGLVNPPLTAIFGAATLRLDLNGGPDLPSTATLTWVGRNSTFGNSDNMIGAQGDLVIAQAPAPTASVLGPWTQRSAVTGSGAFVDNTDYTRTTASAAPGPIGPLATNGEYFTLGTVAAAQMYDSSRVTQDTVSTVISGARNVQVIGIKVNTTGSLFPLTVTQFSLNTTGTTSVADLDSAKIFYTGTSPLFSTGTRFGSAVASPSGSFTITGSQALTAGSNYFWLAYDVNINAPTSNVIDGECTSVRINAIPYTPSVTAPAGNRPILNLNSGGPFGGYYFANNFAVSAPSRPNYEWIDPIAAGHTQITTWTSGTGDDGYFGNTYIGFPFTFFGTVFDSLFIGSNGLVTFGTAPATTAYGANIPNAATPNNLIAGCWMDIDTRSTTYPAAKVLYGGNASQFVVTYLNVHDFGSLTDSITFQIILYPDGNIKVQYNDLQSTIPLPASINNDLVAGIEDATGANGIGYRNNGFGAPVMTSPVAVMYGMNINNLPVQLASFTARINQGGGVRLDWRTLSEINNYGFYVERRLSSEQSYTLLPNSFQPGYGTTNEPRDYFFVDRTVTPGTYFYRLRQQDFDGTIHLTEPITITYGVTSAGNEPAPREFSLKQNYPNPFNPTTEIKFSVENTARATLEIYNLLGQKVATLFDDVAEAGQYYRVQLNAANFASGMYLYRLQSGARTDLKKMLLLK